jgi:hypothetical protein
MPGGWLRDRGTFHRTEPSRTPSREPVAARCTGWPACAASARFHRCTKTPARPLLAPLSRDESRPRAPLRLLQVDVSTSTTTDHPNIALRAVRGRDGCLGSTGSRLPIETAAGAPRGQGSGQTDARHSRSRLLTPETSPQPRSLQAPRVARRHPSPVWSDAVRWWRCRRRAPLQGAPADQGGMASGIREEARRRPARGTFRHLAFASERACAWKPKLPDRRRRLFHHRPAVRGTPARASDGSTARPEGGEPSSVDPSQRPRVTSAFE